MRNDLSFGHLYLCFTFVFKIRVVELMAQETSVCKTLDQKIRLNVFSFFGEKNCSSISPKKKNNENSFEMVNNPSLAMEEELS